MFINVSASLPCTNSTCLCVIYRNFCEQNRTIFKSEIAALSWEELCLIDDVDDLNKRFFSVIEHGF